jgi:hypothetical protein
MSWHVRQFMGRSVNGISTLMPYRLMGLLTPLESVKVSMHCWRSGTEGLLAGSEKKSLMDHEYKTKGISEGERVASSENQRSSHVQSYEK